MKRARIIGQSAPRGNLDVRRDSPRFSRDHTLGRDRFRHLACRDAGACLHVAVAVRHITA
jgi:hypothetical protein